MLKNYKLNRSVKARQTGISIIELLISLVISIAIVAGSVQVVVTSKRNFLDQDEVTFIQTNARYALDLLAKDIRMAGFTGCATQTSMQVANSIDDDSNGYVSLHGLQGFEGETNTDGFPSDFKDIATAGTDAILIRRASDSGEFDVKSHNPTSAEIKLWQDHKIEKGTTLVIADASCRNVGLFQVSGPVGLPADHIVHNTGSGTNNCTKIIKGNFKCLPSCKATECDGYDKSTGEYGPGSKVMQFISRGYFVGESDVMPGMPALKRQAFNDNGAPSTATEELAVGVEDFEILYGVDSSGDGSVDQYRKASQMDVNSDTVIDDEDWDQVLTVKISLVFRSQNQVLSSAQAKTLAGTDYNDRYMRQVVNSTVRIRNRG